MNRSASYNPNVKKYDPMGSQSGNNRTTSYVAYRKTEKEYKVVNYTETPTVPPMPQYNPLSKSRTPHAVNGYVTRKTRPSILQRLVKALYSAGINMKKTILDFFRRSREK